MNKTGELIAKLRKEKNLTQLELANKLFVSDRTVSKWERGVGIPDSSLMIPLCNILDISVNELLLGQKINKEEIDKKNEELIFVLNKKKEEQDKLFLTLEIILGIFTILVSFTVLFGAIFFINDELIKVIACFLSLLFIFIGISLCLVIEQRCGYYECQNCHHKYVPSFKSVFFAMHTNRSRYMKCPKCNKKSWNKKVIK